MSPVLLRKFDEMFSLEITELDHQDEKVRLCFCGVVVNLLAQDLVANTKTQHRHAGLSRTSRCVPSSDFY